ncbi:MAG: hypothetical protein WAK17_04555 [Candidatus Nitrosopolaris sp.]|jgi:hypothetical protein
MALLFATVAMIGTMMGTQFAEAWYHGGHGHYGGHISAMTSGGGGSSSGSSGGSGSGY